MADYSPFPQIKVFLTDEGRRKKGCYKHIPHKDKPPHLVARRNARERRRVEAVNSAFAQLRKCVPIENRTKRLSKVKTLHRAIEYINGLEALLQQANLSNVPGRDPSQFHELEDFLESDGNVVNKENENQSWSTFTTSCESNYWTPYKQEFSGSITS
ncbi:BHLH domain-containing protein [Nephila pilipes]|uniref:BHLH domain-containing protein n=1 Tax=Nephila pilipes TaxID=299642 RepID=A0A8X6NWW0_NEPPI|nr:BHLH domain-containing protein [Nephila pilipes]